MKPTFDEILLELTTQGEVVLDTNVDGVIRIITFDSLKAPITTLSWRARLNVKTTSFQGSSHKLVNGVANNVIDSFKDALKKALEE